MYNISIVLVGDIFDFNGVFGNERRLDSMLPTDNRIDIEPAQQENNSNAAKSEKKIGGNLYV